MNNSIFNKLEPTTTMTAPPFPDERNAAISSDMHQQSTLLSVPRLLPGFPMLLIKFSLIYRAHLFFQHRDDHSIPNDFPTPAYVELYANAT